MLSTEVAFKDYAEIERKLYFPVGWSGGWVAGLFEIITNSAQLKLELGLSLAKGKKLLSSEYEFPLSLIKSWQFSISYRLAKKNWPFNEP